MPNRTPRALALCAATILIPAAANAQVSYNRAERLLPWNTTLLVSGDEVRPQWFLDGNRFWYRNKSDHGAEFVEIDPVHNTRTLLFDNTRLAAAMSVANDTSYDPMRLPFRAFKFTHDGADEHEIEFTTGKRRFVCDVAAYQCTVGDTLRSDVPFVLSPDKKWEAFIHKWNVYVRPRHGGDSTQLTSDGVEEWSYGITAPRPVTLLRAAPDGRVVRKLEEADVTRLAAAGWRPARVFTVKARDGVTDLYGVLYLPPKLDTTKKYPIIDNIYPGPQVGSVGAWSFKGGGEPFSLAELGFVVIQLDHLGTPFRSKAFHDNYYGNFGDNGLPDHITAIKQLAARYKFIDLDRVGIFGHSGGGFASTDALLRYPDFFKVAVSGSGNHDNRSYNSYWSEKYQGLLERDTLRKTDNFAASANKSLAKNLRGHLLLFHGDMDDNVHPANTIQLIDELIKANRTFDFVLAPNRNHSLTEPYFIRRRWDYFVQYLLGEMPPVDYEIVRPQEPGGSTAGTPEPDEP